jgi:hypothetical protein
MKIQAMAEMHAQEELEDDEEGRLRAGHSAAAPTVCMDGIDDMDVESVRDEQENPDSVDNDKVSREAVAPVTQKGVSSLSRLVSS